MVYLHAGEFRFGSSNDLENNWPFFANGQVILVTANVRLGLFGFAALDELRTRDPAGSTGNYGSQPAVTMRSDVAVCRGRRLVLCSQWPAWCCNPFDVVCVCVCVCSGVGGYRFA